MKNKLIITIFLLFVFLALFPGFVSAVCPQREYTSNELRNNLRTIVFDFLSDPISSPYYTSIPPHTQEIQDLLAFYKSEKDNSLITDCDVVVENTLTNTEISTIMEKTIVFEKECSDGDDNDGDGKIDLADPGCIDSQDNDERNQCSDEVDNDDDGKIDLADPGCIDSQDNDEINPVVISVTPPIGSNAGGTDIEIEGSNFIASPLPTVTIGEKSATSISVPSSSIIQAKTPEGIVGPADVTVKNDDGGSDTLSGGFTYIPPPTVSSVEPSNGPASGGTSVKIHGTLFFDKPTVQFGATTVNPVNVIFDNSEQLTVITPVGSGAVNVIVINLGGGSDTKTGGFTYEVELLPDGASCSVDNDCVSDNCYIDADGDRYAPSSGSKTCHASTQLSGTDCDDDDPLIWFSFNGLCLAGMPVADVFVENLDDSADPVALGVNYDYNAVAKNDGPDTAYNTRLKIKLPTDTTYSTASSGCTYDAGLHEVNCLKSTLTSGSTWNVFATVSALNTGTHTAWALATSDSTDPVCANSMTETTASPPGNFCPVSKFTKLPTTIAGDPPIWGAVSKLGAGNGQFYSHVDEAVQDGSSSYLRTEGAWWHDFRFFFMPDFSLPAGKRISHVIHKMWVRKETSVSPTWYVVARDDKPFFFTTPCQDDWAVWPIAGQPALTTSWQEYNKIETVNSCGAPYTSANINKEWFQITTNSNGATSTKFSVTQMIMEICYESIPPPPVGAPPAC